MKLSEKRRDHITKGGGKYYILVGLGGGNVFPKYCGRMGVGTKWVKLGQA